MAPGKNSFYLPLDLASSVPAFQQIVDGIKALVAKGQLRIEDQLPPVRELATDLRLNRNTVAKAYALLEAEGIISTKVGAGSYISGRPSPLSEAERERRVRRHLAAAVIEAYHQEVVDEKVVEILKEEIINCKL